jgi:hypothetical protein
VGLGYKETNKFFSLERKMFDDRRFQVSEFKSELKYLAFFNILKGNYINLIYAKIGRGRAGRI